MKTLDPFILPPSSFILCFMRAFVYILRCSDGTFYTGYTLDLERRLSMHQRGRGAKYTRTRTPVELVHTEAFRTRRAAMRREVVIKRMSRARKLELFQSTPR